MLYNIVALVCFIIRLYHLSLSKIILTSNNFILSDANSRNGYTRIVPTHAIRRNECIVSKCVTHNNWHCPRLIFSGPTYWISTFTNFFPKNRTSHMVRSKIQPRSQIITMEKTKMTIAAPVVAAKMSLFESFWIIMHSMRFEEQLNGDRNYVRQFLFCVLSITKSTYVFEWTNSIETLIVKEESACARQMIFFFQFCFNAFFCLFRDCYKWHPTMKGVLVKKMNIYACTRA